ncbi:MAG: ATP-dependent zinc metalloprotease FtsH [Pirellulaceae bacterium]|nr:ATP-dependent zinc metalloprotease FtsH [Pirellulaceae bacterium]
MNSTDPAPERSASQNLLWLILGGISLIVIVLLVWQSYARTELTPLEFKQLVEKNAREELGGAYKKRNTENREGEQKEDLVEGINKQKAEKKEVIEKIDRKLVIFQDGIYYRYYNLEDVKQYGDDTSGTISAKVKREQTVNLKSQYTGERSLTIYVPYNGESSWSEIRELLEKSKINYKHVKENFFVSNAPILIMIVLMIVLFVLFMRKMGGAGSPMAFGRSRGKLVAQDDLTITFKDVAGIDEAVEEVREIVDFLQAPEKYQRLGGRVPKGILLVGPPGTGKTLLAKAIAGEAGVSFFNISGSDFVEMFVGVGAARVRDMFQQATLKAPCIIFIDELDALGKSRGGSIVGGNDEREQTLNALLVEMDGFSNNSGIIVMAATNRPETLDGALMRPGRFDRHVLVDRPDIGGRHDILKVHVKRVKLAQDVELAEVAKLTSGFSGADLENLVNEAALLAARGDKEEVSFEEFNEGVERVTAGLEKKKKVINEDEKLRVAYHESGHALVASCLPNTDPVHKVSIIPRGLAALGYTLQRPEEERFLMTQGELESRIQVLLAGTLAEEITFSDISTGAQNDLERATEIARNMVSQYGMSALGRVNYKRSNRSPFLPEASGDETSGAYSEATAREIDLQVKKIIDELLEKTKKILVNRKGTLEALSLRLMEVEVIGTQELKEIIEDKREGPQVVPGTEALGEAQPKAEGKKTENDNEVNASDQGLKNKR